MKKLGVVGVQDQEPWRKLMLCDEESRGVGWV